MRKLPPARPHVLLQVPAQLWNFPDRKDTCTGGVINEYLAGSKELNDQAVHLLFSANRHEKRSAYRLDSCILLHAHSMLPR